MSNHNGRRQFLVAGSALASLALMPKLLRAASNVAETSPCAISRTRAPAYTLRGRRRDRQPTD